MFLTTFRFSSRESVCVGARGCPMAPVVSGPELRGKSVFRSSLRCSAAAVGALLSSDHPPPPRLSTPASDSLERKSSPVVVPLPFPPQGHLVCREALDMSPVLWQGLWTLCSTPPPRQASGASAVSTGWDASTGCFQADEGAASQHVEG